MVMAMADLPNDILRLIFKKLTDLLDILRLRGVCHSWRCVANIFNNRKVTPLLLIPNNHLEEQPQLLNFHKNTAAQPCGSIGLPSGLSKARCVCSHRGWLLMKGNNRICLYNPLSMVHVRLPSLPKTENPNCTIRFITSRTRSDPNCTILVRIEDWCLNKICLCKRGDQTWRSIFTITGVCDDMIYHRGQLYTIDNSGRLDRFKVGKKFLVAEEVIAGTPLRVTPVKYLVESSSGELMMAVRHAEWSASFVLRTRFFEVFKLNWRRRAWEEVNSLGGQALLLTSDDSILVPAETGFRRDCIYFLDDHWVGQSNSHFLDFGVYEMGTGNVDNIDQFSFHILNAARICRWFRPCV